MVAQNPLLAWHTVAFPNTKPRRLCPFTRSALAMNPLWLARKEPYNLLQTLGHGRVPMLFLGSVCRTRGREEKGGLLRSEPYEGSTLRNRPIYSIFQRP
jgi:hypothetical protein